MRILPKRDPRTGRFVARSRALVRLETPEPARGRGWFLSLFGLLTDLGVLTCLLLVLALALIEALL